MKEGEPAWCKSCERFFDESLAEHGREFHSDEQWDVDYQKCDRCAGDGQVYEQRNIVRCPKCDGTGSIE